MEQELKVKILHDLKRVAEEIVRWDEQKQCIERAVRRLIADLDKVPGEIDDYKRNPLPDMGPDRGRFDGKTLEA